MLRDLAAPWLIGLNVFAWLIIHVSVAWLGTLLPSRIFRPDDWAFRSRAWERPACVYERILRVRRWKDLLPDGAALFRGGFRKKRLVGTSRTYLERFAKETCRGEAVHWVVLSASPLFFLWNPWWAGVVMVVYALFANLPCIIVQRYNRMRLWRVLRSEDSSGSRGRPVG